MIDLKESIGRIINQETEAGRFSVLDETSIDLIEQIMKNYERTHSLAQDFNNIPKQADLVFVAAPTGAGKDGLVLRLNYFHPEKRYIELNMDIFRHYYSKYIPNVKLEDKTFAEQTSEFSYEMYYTIQEILLKEFPGTNIIITGTLWKTDWVEETFRKFKENEFTNYNITLASLAVPEKDSAFSILKRYVSIVDNGIVGRDTNGNIICSPDFEPGSARYTSLDYHNATFEKFPENLKYFQDLFQRGELIDSMEVYKRSAKENDFSENTLVYSSNDGNLHEITALDVTMQLRQSKPQFTQDDIFALFEVLTSEKNKAYFKSQNVIEEIIFDLAEILEKQDILQKHLDKRNKKTNPDTDENPGFHGDGSEERF